MCIRDRHFPAPWGNELRIGPLEALLAVMVSVVMFLTITAGSRQIFEEIVPEKQKFYFIMLNATYGAMLAMTYTNDMFTGYVFIEILTDVYKRQHLHRGKGRPPA